jgi:hypothetical protein
VELRFVPPNLHLLDEASAELLACCVWSDQRPMRGLAGLLDWRLAGRLSLLARDGFLRGEPGELLFVPGRPRLRFEKVLVFGAGARPAFGEPVFREIITHLLRALEGLRVRRAVVELPGRADGLMEAERAADLVLECVGESATHDAWWLVEPPDAQRRITQRAVDERRRPLVQEPSDAP